MVPLKSTGKIVLLSIYNQFDGTIEKTVIHPSDNEVLIGYVCKALLSRVPKVYNERGNGNGS